MEDMREHMRIKSLTDLFSIGMDRVMTDPLPFPTTGTILNVGAGNKHIIGSIPLDYPDWDADTDEIPYKDGSVSGIHCYHFLEHVAEPARVLLEFQRVLEVGGLINIVVPYYNSQMQAQDLDHKARYCEMTWKTLFLNPYYDKNRIEWRLHIVTNVIMGVVERNLALVTQLQKR